jgi:hypothetical protein
MVMNAKSAPNHDHGSWSEHLSADQVWPMIWQWRADLSGVRVLKSDDDGQTWVNHDFEVMENL